MKIFYAFEIVTNSSFHIQVDQDPGKRNELFNSEVKRLGQWLDGPSIIGHVYAHDVESAINKIRCGKWDEKWNISNLSDEKVSNLE